MRTQTASMVKVTVMVRTAKMLSKLAWYMKVTTSQNMPTSPRLMFPFQKNILRQKHACDRRTKRGLTTFAISSHIWGPCPGLMTENLQIPVLPYFLLILSFMMPTSQKQSIFGCWRNQFLSRPFLPSRPPCLPLSSLICQVLIMISSRYFCLWNRFSNSHIWSLKKSI